MKPIRSERFVNRAFHNFVRGVGSAIELAPAGAPLRLRRKLGLPRSDADALKGDWQRVGGDLRRAVAREAEKLGEHVEQEQTRESGARVEGIYWCRRCQGNAA